MESTATRNVTVLITAAAIAHMEHVCVIQDSMAGFVTYVSPAVYQTNNDLKLQEILTQCDLPK